jgi:hypothetical protein
MQGCKTAGISFPVEIIKKIDEERGDVSRSRYILRLVLRGMKNSADLELESRHLPRPNASSK